MPQEPNFQDDPYLAERLGEARDWANFTPRRAPTGSSEVVRAIEIPGAEHLGGRTVSDRFVRSGSAPAPKPTPTPGRRKLEPHLEARLAEVQDLGFQAGGKAPGEEAVEAYRALRRKLGGA